MKIPLLVGKYGDSLSPFLSYRLYIPGAKIPLYITRALVDTGSFETFIGQTDLEKGFRMQRKLRDIVLNSQRKDIRLGGSIHPGYPIRDVTIRMQDDEGRLVDIPLERVYGIYGGKESAQIPSIIGTDFLLKNNFALYFDPSKKEAYLYREE